MDTQRKTNVQVLTELMEFSKNGALIQAFVMVAIQKYADQCIKAGAARFHTELLDGDAWVACAKEARGVVKAHLGT